MKKKNIEETRIGNAKNVFAFRAGKNTTVLLEDNDKIGRKIFRNGTAKEDTKFSLSASSAALLFGILIVGLGNRIYVKGEQT